MQLLHLHLFALGQTHKSSKQILSRLVTRVDSKFLEHPSMFSQVPLMQLHQFTLKFVFIFVYLAHVFPHEFLYIQVFISRTLGHLTRVRALWLLATVGSWASGNLATCPGASFGHCSPTTTAILFLDLVKSLFLLPSDASLILLAQNVRF